MAAAATQGTLRPFPGFNAEQDAKAIREAMKGAGTNEAAITNILAFRSTEQRVEIRQKYKTLIGKALEDELEGELSGKYRQVIKALLLESIAYDVEECHRAMKGAGTDEDALVEILCTRSNSDILKIKAAYKLKYKSDLEDALVSESSGHFRRLLVSLSTGNRSEDPKVDPAKVKQDVQALYDAGEKKLGTDESVFNQVLCSRSPEHLRAVIAEYPKLSKLTLEKAIESEMSGDLKRGMIAILHAVTNKPRYFAERLHWSMKGLGTNDDTLIRIIVSRCEIDMVQIIAEFQKVFGKSLESFITGDTSGDYRNVLLALVKGQKAAK
jgi:hypothetical protein